MYNETTINIAKSLWESTTELDKLIRALEAMHATKLNGIAYSGEDFDLQQNIAAELFKLSVRF